jgi:hypothetical protein
MRHADHPARGAQPKAELLPHWPSEEGYLQAPP